MQGTDIKGKILDYNKYLQRIIISVSFIVIIGILVVAYGLGLHTKVYAMYADPKAPQGFPIVKGEHALDLHDNKVYIQCGILIPSGTRTLDIRNMPFKGCALPWGDHNIKTVTGLFVKLPDGRTGTLLTGNVDMEVDSSIPLSEVQEGSQE